jgi:hypothetical protein
MIDRDARNDLAESLRRLVDGDMTNDEFDDGYHGRWCESKDAAVVEISGFGYSLYSSDLLWPYRLKGRHAVPAQTREIAQHAIRFLQTDLEYEWPTNVRGIVPFWCLWGPAFLRCRGRGAVGHRLP